MTQSRGEGEGVRASTNVRRPVVGGEPAGVPRGTVSEIKRALAERDKRLGIRHVSSIKHTARRKLVDPADKIKGPW